MTDIIKQLQELATLCSRVSDPCTQRTMLIEINEIESLRRQLDQMTKKARKEYLSAIEWAGKHQELSEQLHAAMIAHEHVVAEKDAEIKRLKEDVAIEAANGRHWSNAYSEWVKSDKVAQKLIEYEAKNWLLETQLAASQLREQRLREASEKLLASMSGTLAESVFAFQMLILKESLRGQPTDTSALEAVVQRAGEVMRERCLSEIDPKYYTHGLLKEVVEGCCGDLRALPGVTMEDLRK